MPIQGNPLGLKQIEARLFNVYSIDNHKYLDIQEVMVWSKVTSIPFVELIETSSSFAMNTDAIRALAECQVYSNGKPAEGIVIRPVVEQTVTVNGETLRLSFKAINLAYKD